MLQVRRRWRGQAGNVVEVVAEALSLFFLVFLGAQPESRRLEAYDLAVDRRRFGTSSRKMTKPCRLQFCDS